MSNVAPATPGASSATIPAIATPTTTPQVAATSVPAAGPYDPNGYQPSPAIGSAPTVGEMPSTGERYAAPVADRYAAVPTNPPRPAATPSLDRYAIPAETPPATPSSPSATSSAPVPYSAATVQLSAPPGQYRPGGTSNYTSDSATQPIEVAARPAPSNPTNVPEQPIEPAGTSVPWSPPATTSPELGPGTRTY
jgi:hypothetical protein